LDLSDLFDPSTQPSSASLMLSTGGGGIMSGLTLVDPPPSVSAFAQSLKVTAQSSISKQEWHANKLHKWLFVVVKNSPFDIHLQLDDIVDALCGGARVSFERASLGVELVYAHSLALVPHPTGEAVTFEVPERSDKSLVLRVRIHVLSSKHEKFNFALRVTVIDETGAPCNHLSAVCDPIKVVSKPDQALRCALGAALPTTSTPMTAAVAMADQKVRRRTASALATDDSEDEFDHKDGVATDLCSRAHRSSLNKRRRNVAAAGTSFLSGVGAAEAIASLLAGQQAMQEKLDKLMALLATQ